MAFTILPRNTPTNTLPLSVPPLLPFQILPCAAEHWPKLSDKRDSLNGAREDGTPYKSNGNYLLFAKLAKVGITHVLLLNVNSPELATLNRWSQYSR